MAGSFSLFAASPIEVCLSRQDATLEARGLDILSSNCRLTRGVAGKSRQLLTNECVFGHRQLNAKGKAANGEGSRRRCLEVRASSGASGSPFSSPDHSSQLSAPQQVWPAPFAAEDEARSRPFDPERVKLTQRLLLAALREEDYATAAKMRDLLSALQQSDPKAQLECQVAALERQLSHAVKEERYKEAMSLRDKLREIAPPPPPPAPRVPTHSETTTQGVCVAVLSVFVSSRSNPLRRHYFFAYRVTVTNNSSRTCQLLGRHWKIVDGDGEENHVRGPGVVGEQPILRPGESFEYTSACPLPTPRGTMEGEYEMVYLDGAEESQAQDGRESPSKFSALIGPFGLDAEADRGTIK